ncbi:unnamed protein product, partial [Clonostachys rhizophaga]
MPGGSAHKITVVGEDRVDLFRFEREDKTFLQKIDSRPRLLCRFLKEGENAASFQTIGDVSANSLAGISSVTELSGGPDGTYKVNRQLLIDTVHPRQRDSDQLSDETSPNGTPGVLVVDDPKEALLSKQDSVLDGYTPSLVVFQANSLNNMDSQSSLFKIIQKSTLKRLLVVINVDDLRNNGKTISKHESWEKTAANTMAAKLSEAFSYAAPNKTDNITVIIRFGYVGAMVLQGGSNRLYFCPRRGEGDFLRSHAPYTSALEAAFLAGLIPVVKDLDSVPDWEIWQKAIKHGFCTARYVAGLGLSLTDELLNYPELEKVCVDLDCKEKVCKKGKKVCEAQVQLACSEVPPSDSPDTWSILARNYADGKMFDLAKDIVSKGIEDALSSIPRATFGKLVVADRSEIQEFHAITNRVEEYLKTPEKRPLSIGVFGAPGSGKSFGIKQIMKKATHGASGTYPELEYNLSQFLDYSNLLVAFQTVRDKTVSGQIPIVYFDEFDTTLNGELGWLKFFLAPMQDGTFFDHGYSRPIGRAIFIFIGGTAATFDEFKNDQIQLIPGGFVRNDPIPEGSSTTVGDEIKAVEDAKAAKAARAVKKPDFVSRLHVQLNIRGYNKVDNSDEIYMIRRAIFLQSILKSIGKRITLKRGEGITVSDEALPGLLRDWTYHHGARSLEAIINGGTITQNKLTPLSSGEQWSLHAM